MNRSSVSDAGRAPQSALRQTFEDETLSGRVLLDERRFVRCRFESAVLVYTGQGAPPRLEDCTFVRSRIEFEGAADRTLAFLQAMAKADSGLRGVVRATFATLFGH